MSIKIYAFNFKAAKEYAEWLNLEYGDWVFKKSKIIGNQCLVFRS